MLILFAVLGMFDILDIYSNSFFLSSESNQIRCIVHIRHPSTCGIGPTPCCFPSSVRDLVALKFCSAAQIQDSILYARGFRVALVREDHVVLRVRTSGLGARKEPPLLFHPLHTVQILTTKSVKSVMK